MENTNFNELIKRLEKLELMQFSTSRDYIEDSFTTFTSHILYLALYGDLNNNYDHWCKELANMFKIMKTKRMFENKSRKMTWIEIYKYLINMGSDIKYYKEQAIDSENQEPFYEYSDDFLEIYRTSFLKELLVETYNEKGNESN